MSGSPGHVQASGESYTFPAETSENYDLLFKVVLIGDAGVGKTCVVQRFKHGIYMERFGNTIGVDFMLKTVETNGKRIKLQIWDTAGQERFRTITQSYYRGSQGVIVAYDITNAQSFEHVPQWVDDVKRYAGPDATILLIGTKVDLALTSSEARQVELSEAKNLAESLHMLGAIETSAKEDTNIERTFVKLGIALAKKHNGLIPYAEPEESIHVDTRRLLESGHSNQLACDC